MHSHIASLLPHFGHVTTSLSPNFILSPQDLKRTVETDYEILHLAKLVLEHSNKLLGITTGCQQHNMINITLNLQVTST